MEKIPCPFIYSTGRRCAGHIVRIEAYKAEVIWSLGDGGGWEFSLAPRSHYHLFCSEKGNHAGKLRQDDPQMKFHWSRLPPALQEIIAATDVVAPSAGAGSHKP